MMMNVDRRKFIIGSASALAVASLPEKLLAFSQKPEGIVSILQKRNAIVLYKENSDYSNEFATILADNGIKAVALSDNLVRQWRDGLGEALTVQGRPLLGLTNWSDYCLIRGLSAESRRFPILEAQHNFNSQNVSAWVKEYANNFVADQDVDVSQYQSLVADNQSTKLSIFSWVVV